MENEIVVQENYEITQLSKNMGVLKKRMALLKQATAEILVSNLDYGVIPGAGSKPTLLKPGAEKLCFLFGLRPTFELRDKIEDWEGGLFYYRYGCVLHNSAGEVLADGEGSCNSREVKYRYRQGERKCPKCGKATIIKGRAEYGGGWVCFAKKGGCGAKFADGDKAIEGQDTGKVENPDPADLINTLQKMAQKRALIAAVLVGAGASQFFTQDVEDMVDFSIEEAKPARVERPSSVDEQVASILYPDKSEAPGGMAYIEAAARTASKPTINAFPTPAAAIAWGMDSGVFAHINHAQNAYDKLKREHNPQDAEEMGALWRADIEKRRQEAQDVSETPAEIAE